MTRRLVLSWLALPAARLCGQGMASRGVRAAPRGKGSGLPFHARFTDVARQAGLNQTVVCGHPDHNDYILECMSCGAAFLEYENDAWLDILVLSGSRFGDPPSTASNRLYKNNRDGTFTDVTRKAGLFRTGFAYGVTVGDYNNDGFEDLFVTYWGQNVLYHNNADGTFTDVTKQAGLLQTSERPRWNTGCSCIDYDRDGNSDLIVANYVDLDLAHTPAAGSGEFCRWKGIPVMCGPRGLPAGTNLLYRNNGNGTFTDVSEKSGISKPRGHYGFTTLTGDFDNDGWPDVYLACDSTASVLYHNNHDGTFTDIATKAGCALNQDGLVQAGMGATAGDYDRDGWFDIFKTDFSDDTSTLYRNNADGTFSDVTLDAGMGINTRYLGWGCGFVDLDNDGWLD